MKLKTLAFVLITFTLLVGLSAVALAQGGDPLKLFTDNVASTGPTTDVTEMEQQLLDRLNVATTSIDASIYSLNRVSIRNALIDAHNRGVTVRVVADDDAYDEAGYNPHFQALEAAGIPLVLDNRSSLMHNKFFIIDDFVVWSGSTNMTDTGFTYNHNNSLVFTSTQLADIFSTEFEEMFISGLFGTAKSDNTTHTLTYAGHPLELYFSPTDGAMSEVISEVNAADESIYFSVFFFTDDALRDAIIAKKQVGVTVQGIFDKLGASNRYSEDETLCDADIPIKVEDFGGKMHNKFMVIDSGGTDPVVVTGSMNWTSSGGDANDENTLIVHDLGTAQAYVAAFQELYNALGDETLCTGSHLIFVPILMRGTSGPPPAPDVRITYIEYNPPGDDVQGEYVQIDNAGSAPANTSGWTLKDDANNTFTFPSFTLSASASVRVWTKAGAHTGTDLYWGRGSAVWNNTGDCAYLMDGRGVLVSTYCY
jgi:phosphatidylserine/phosphatidylglycerophosphate/cardiolipin synthase-like enzyme